MSGLPPPSEETPLILALPLRWALMIFAVLCLVLAVIGVIVPGMPTTVFVLMAAWAAARSSPRFSQWMEKHRLFGPMILDWRAGGFVSRRAKWSAGLMMGLCAIILFGTHTPPVVAFTASAIMAVVLLWLCQRPEREKSPLS
ncbi:MAG: YbaN family protein [Moraxellaceae bacterium]